MEENNEDLKNALGFVYFWIVAADGDISEEEIKTLNDYTLYNKYCGGGAINNDFKNEIEDLGERFILAFKAINAELSKEELKELYYEANKLMFADGKLDENEQGVFTIISHHISLTEEEKSESMGRFTDELKAKTNELKAKLNQTNTPPSSNNESKCYVVTASYGNETHPNVVYLRNYRDNNLSKHFLGIIFISTYEVIGPLVAKIIKNSETLKKYSTKYIIQPSIKYLKKKGH